MRKKIVITDLTRMHRGKVCLAGYDSDHTCIRPVLPPPGIPEDSIYLQNKPVIFPFALVEFDFIKPDPQPPHTEDYLYDPDSPSLIRLVHDRETILNWSLFPGVQEIFEQPIHDDFGYYVMDCQGPRSVGTIEPMAITNIIYEISPEGVWDFRIWFYDKNQHYYRLKIVDLTWHYYCDSLRDENRNPSQIAKELNRKLTKNQVYLRIGLSRGWEKFPERCYLQITAIHTFPDYLQGKTIADYSPKSN